MNEIEFLSSAYGRHFARGQKNVTFAGSPQRCLHRFLIQEGTELFVAEQIRPSQAVRRQEIGHILNGLRQSGLAVTGYLETQEGGYVACTGPDFWQVAPFVKSKPLVRPDYVFDAWRGEALADFLLQLAAVRVDSLQEPRFSLRVYIVSLLEKMARNEPDLWQRVQPFFSFIDELLQISEQTTSVFSHGDFHPLNILWGQSELAGVIDWEFCGYKCQLYDVANLVGCIGIEHPDFLEEQLVQSFLDRLGQSGYVHADLVRKLPLLMLSLRFAWLSEWLRARDKDMIELELAYMDFLCQNSSRLGEKWGLWG